MAATIKRISANEILDSRGNPTVAVGLALRKLKHG
jgi:enolase